MGKPRIKFQRSYRKKGMDEIAEAIWKKYGEYTSTDAKGQPVTYNRFRRYIKQAYEGAKMYGSELDAKRAALEAYNNSAFYRSKEDRFATFGVSDFFGGAPDAEKKFRNLLRDERGRFVKYDPHKMEYIRTVHGDAGGSYREYVYEVGGKRITTKYYDSPGAGNGKGGRFEIGVQRS